MYRVVIKHEEHGSKGHALEHAIEHEAHRRPDEKYSRGRAKYMVFRVEDFDHADRLSEHLQGARLGEVVIWVAPEHAAGRRPSRSRSRWSPPRRSRRSAMGRPEWKRVGVAKAKERHGRQDVYGIWRDDHGGLYARYEGYDEGGWMVGLPLGGPSPSAAHRQPYIDFHEKDYAAVKFFGKAEEKAGARGKPKRKPKRKAGRAVGRSKPVRAVVGRPRGKKTTAIQTLLFSKAAGWTAAQAKVWLLRNSFSAQLDETGGAFRARQRDPGEFQKKTFRTITLPAPKKARAAGRRKKSTRRKAHSMMTYGTMPSWEAFDAAFDRELGANKYDISLGREDSAAADGTSIGDGEYSARELYKGLKELVATGRDDALDLASSILSTLGFEWV